MKAVYLMRLRYPLKSAVSRPLPDFDLEREFARKEGSPAAGANVQPCRWGCGPLARAFRQIVYPILYAAITTFISIRAEGLEHLERVTGPVIFASTHESTLDFWVFLAALPVRRRQRIAIVMGDWVFWHGWVGGRPLQNLHYWALVLLGNVFTIPPGSLRSTLHHVDFLASHGWSILIFPEGAHTPWLLPFQPGVGWLARHSRLPVVPLYIEGMGAIRPRGASWLRPGHICVRFG